MKSLLLILLRMYKIAISPLLGQHCRFYPSCSEYAQQAIIEHGALRGSALACQRVCKCHPWHAGGIDPVPKHKRSNDVANVADHVTRSHP